MPHMDLMSSLDALTGRNKQGGGRIVRCPIHEDRQPSLSIDTGTDGALLLKCMAGCETEDIVTALGATMADLYPDAPTNGGHVQFAQRRPASSGRRSFEARYADGAAAGLHWRTDDGAGNKSIWWEPRGIDVKRLALYLSWDTGQGPVVIAEGERSAIAIRAAGYTGAGTYGASAMPSPPALEFLRGREAVLWPDNDEAGRDHMAAIAAALAHVATGVRVVALPATTPKGWDAADTTADEIRALVASAAPLGESTPPHNEVDMLQREVEDDFPAPPEPAAFGGLLGEIVDHLAAGTDASLVGLLGSLIAFSGAVIPGSAYWNRPQTTSPFIALIGESSIGRKGTAMLRAQGAIADAVDLVTVNRVGLDGVNSGEGLIAELSYRQKTYQYEPTVGLIFEEEFAALIASRSREGSTLDQKIRQAFDGGVLSNRKAGESKTVEPPYWLPALIAITPDELRHRLEANSLRNGSANRWLYLPVVRRDVMSGNTDPRLPDDLRDPLREARKNALSRKVPLPVASRVNETLSEYGDFLRVIKGGLTHDLTPRYTVIALRIALVHAMVERASVVQPEHLARALALTEYARSGLGWVFGESVGDPLASLLLRQIKQGPLTSNAITQRLIRDPLKRQNAIDELTRLGYANIVNVHETGGRPRKELQLDPTRGAFVRFVPGFASPSGREWPKPADNARNSTNGLHETARNSVEPLHETARNGTKPAVWLHPCQDFIRHQTSHRQTSAGWVCDACGGEA